MKLYVPTELYVRLLLNATLRTEAANLFKISSLLVAATNIISTAHIEKREKSAHLQYVGQKTDGTESENRPLLKYFSYTFSYPLVEVMQKCCYP